MKRKFLAAVFLIAVFGCSQKEVQIRDTTIDESFIGEDLEREPYGHFAMCVRSFRLKQDNIFCSRENMCKTALKRITVDKNGNPQSGRVDDIEFYWEFCR